MGKPKPHPVQYKDWQAWGSALLRALDEFAPIGGSGVTQVTIPNRFAGPALVTGAAATKFTAPAKAISILKHIHVQNPSGAPVNFTMSIGADAAGTRIFDALPIAAGGYLSPMVHFVLQAGEIIQAWAGTTNILTLTLDGDVTPLNA